MFGELGGASDSMRLEDTGIYPYVSDYLDSCRLMDIEGGVNFCPAYDDTYPIWYVVSGVVDICATSQAGRTFVVDTNVEDEFAGHLSNYWGQNFYCACITRVPPTLLRISPKLFHETLIRCPEFRAFFYFKTSVRLYEMFKQKLAGDFFSDRQIFADYLVQNANDGICRLESASDAARRLQMSRRNFYNVLHSLEREGLVTHPTPDEVVLLNVASLQRIAEPVRRFMNNEM